MFFKINFNLKIYQNNFIFKIFWYHYIKIIKKNLKN
jgi:hypothetical protein